MLIRSISLHVSLDRTCFGASEDNGNYRGDGRMHSCPLLFCMTSTSFGMISWNKKVLEVVPNRVSSAFYLDLAIFEGTNVVGCPVQRRNHILHVPIVNLIACHLDLIVLLWILKCRLSLSFCFLKCSKKLLPPMSLLCLSFCTVGSYALLSVCLSVCDNTKSH